MEVSANITRKSASNLALAFVLLPKERRQGMAALYAFCREVDDVADEEKTPVAERRKQLAAWREDVRQACTGGKPQFAVNQELQPIIATYRLPFELFDEIILGVEMDLDVDRYATYAELEQYCYRVASAVGLLSIEIFGYQDARCREYAVYLGKALQYTNILRDVWNDAERGRIYLPQEELDRHGVRPEEILRGEYSERYFAAASAMGQKARWFYQQAQKSLPDSERRAMGAAELMGSVYWRLLEKLEARRFNVFTPQPARLSKAHKLFLIARTWYRLSTGALVPNYGTP
jgi:phytoene synthase